MNHYQKLIDRFQKKPPKILLNIILDGFGIGPKDETNGVYLAKTPFLDSLRERYEHTTLLTHGKHVGLPEENDLGGSEVGHITIGAGFVPEQGSKMIKKQIQSGEFAKSENFQKMIRQAKKHSLHLIGLLSDGNIHSHINYLEAIIKEAAKGGVSKVYLHALLDGRDVPIQSANEYIERIESLFTQILTKNPGYDYRTVSGGGREKITMDRSKNWKKVETGWNIHVEGNSKQNFFSATEAIFHFRKEQQGIVDQDIPGFNIVDEDGNTKKIEDGDVVLCFNFRGDRAIEITRAFAEKNFQEFEITRRPEVLFIGMCVYDEDTNMPANRLFDSPKIENPFGKRLLEMGIHQFRLAETRKFPHVTFFFNGGYRLPLNPEKENYSLIESDVVESFAEKPEMKAKEIATQAIKFIESGIYGYGLINFANPDMVGHSGDIKAVIHAVETVDESLRKICASLEAYDGVALIFADHGNADEMLILNKKTGKPEPSTKHSLNPVPCILFDPSSPKKAYRLKQLMPDSPNNLSMIAATNYILLGKPPPVDLSPPLFEPEILKLCAL